jgi:hypothetical protein
MRKLQGAVRAALISGSVASVLSTVVLSLLSKMEEGSGAGAINAPSQWLWGEREGYTKSPTARHTATGYLIHHMSSLWWATLYEGLIVRGRKRSAARVCAGAAAITAVAYLVDYHVVPRRLRPGFRKHLSPGAILAAYTSFAVGLALAGVVRRRGERPAGAAQL